MRPSARRPFVLVLAFVGSVFLAPPGRAQDSPIRLDRQLVPTDAVKRARVLRTAAVVEEPRGDATVIDTVPPTAVFVLLEERDSWYRVRPPDDGTTWTWSTGWMNAAFLEVLPEASSAATDVPTGKISPASSSSLASSSFSPLPKKLLAARRAYLEQGANVDRARLNRAVRELIKYRPRVLELVGDSPDADVIITLSRGGPRNPGTLVAPITGLGMIAVPIGVDTYRLTVRDAHSQELLWDDHREANWTHGGAVADLVKDFLKRLAENSR